MELGLCKPSSEPTRLTDTNLLAPPLPLTDGADAGDQNANGVPMLVRWRHQNPAPSESRTEPMNKYLFASAAYGVVYPVSFFNFFFLLKHCRIGIIIIKTKKNTKHKMAPFYARFSDFPKYKFTLFSLISLKSLSLTLAGLTPRLWTLAAWLG